MKSEAHFRIDKRGNFIKSTKVEKIFPKSENNFSAINLGYYLVTPLVIGVFLGLVIGEKIHRKEQGALIGIIFGIAGTVYNLVKIVKNNARN